MNMKQEIKETNNYYKDGTYDKECSDFVRRNGKSKYLKEPDKPNWMKKKTRGNKR